ncbi:unnamed protein product [Alopecurus aequalis]
MDKVACCCLKKGGPSPSYSKPSLPCTISFFPGILTSPKRATGRNTKLRCGFSFDFDKYKSAKSKAVDEELERALPVRQPERLTESMRYNVFPGGKRAFPVLAIAACELVGGSAAVATPVACAVEMVHSMALIQDDMPCMDDTPLRRGQPANHVVFGDYTTLLSGDALLARAFEHLACGCAQLPPGRALRAVVEFAAGVGGVAAGQFADKASEGGPVSLAMLDYITVQKTARLLQAAAVCGAIVGGGTDGEIESVRRYARSLGILFQIRDDELDREEDEAIDKDTYLKLMGVDQAHAYAVEALAIAQGELEGFDAERAAPLYHLARFVAYRQN